MALDPEDIKVPLQSETLAHGAKATPGDVSTAGFYKDRSGQIVWGWPTYTNGRQTGVTPVVPDWQRNGTSPYGPYASGYRYGPESIVPGSLYDGPGAQNLPPMSLSNGQGASDPGGGGGGGGNSGVPGWLKNAAAALPAAASLANAPGGNNNSMSPELQQLLAQALKRMSSQDGLFNAVNAQAMAGLPTIYQR